MLRLIKLIFCLVFDPFRSWATLEAEILVLQRGLDPSPARARALARLRRFADLAVAARLPIIPWAQIRHRLSVEYRDLLLSGESVASLPIAAA